MRDPDVCWLEVSIDVSCDLDICRIKETVEALVLKHCPYLAFKSYGSQEDLHD